MGRNTTGIYEVCECNKLELSFFIKRNALKLGATSTGTIVWTTRANRYQEFKKSAEIGFETSYTKEEKFIRLIYKVVEKESGIKREYDYKIQIKTIPSNLGKGQIPYMICPYDGFTKSRVLYMAYSSEKFYSRKYFLNRGLRIYYPSQARSKDDYMYHMKHKLEKREMEYSGKKNFHRTHKGHVTKAELKKLKLRMSRIHWERKCSEQLERKLLGLSRGLWK